MFAYLNLTKPRISLLFAFTGLTMLAMQGNLTKNPLQSWLIVLAIFLIGGSANAFNQFFERDRDLKMARTAKKRPLPLGKISPRSAIFFSVITGILGTFMLWYWGGVLSALLGFGTILFYSFYYTLWLKPRTPYNIVIGGIAGATGPLIAIAAVTGSIDIASFILFLIVFFWTPPHFWALALCCKEDYAKVGLPMLPLVAGDEVTRRQILYYSLFLVPLTLTLYFIHSAGKIYLISAILLGVIFLLGAVQLYIRKTIPVYWRFFGYSIVYLMLLFGAMMVDALV